MPVVHGFWIGTNRLSDLARASILSFQKLGYTYWLWLYDFTSNLPEKVIVQNANDIIPRSQIIYCYKLLLNETPGSHL